ncbi:capsule biosynthesis protein CapZ, partial [Streptomyces sp. NPDC005479]
SVAGSGTVKTDKIHHRHFAGVNSGWRYDRSEGVAQPDAHVYDPRMSRVLDLVFGSSPEEVRGTW